MTARSRLCVAAARPRGMIRTTFTSRVKRGRRRAASLSAASRVRTCGERPWPFPREAVRARESTTGAAVWRLRLPLVRRRASVRWGPLESGRCKRASGRSRQRPPRSGKGVRRSILRSDERRCSRSNACVWRIESGVNCTPAALKIKRSGGRRLAHILVARGLRTAAGRK